MTWTPTLADVGIILTAAGVAVGAYQLLQARSEAQTQFEDSLTKEYRELAAGLPVTAFLELEMSDGNVIDILGGFYRYIDLCNEQAFPHEQHRVSDQTWMQWRDGITSNLGRSGFGHAYSIIAAFAPNNFAELRRIVPPDRFSEDELASMRIKLAERI